jgi:Ferritin-like
VVDLELWTVPYYMAAMYSIRDRTSDAYQLVQDVVHEEMLHVQLASNIANAFGLSPRFAPPVYGGPTVPHIDFALDVPNPTELYTPYSTAIGPLDLERVNTMCLIEYPEWSTERSPDLHEQREEYGSIAEFYDAVRAGMFELRAHLRGGVNQVDEFRFYYNEFPDQTIVHDGDDGYREAIRLIDLITDQGEGQSQGDTGVAPQHQNTADGFEESWSHFKRFTVIRDMARLPATYTGVAEPPAGSPGRRAQEVLVADFAAFMQTLESLFGGGGGAGFGVRMAKIGGDILTCWKRGAVPRFA